MKKLLFVLVLSSSAFAAPAYVQSVYCHGATSSFTCPALTNTSGNTIILVVSQLANSVTSPTITDSKGNTYGTPVVKCNLTTAGHTIMYYVASGIIVGSNTITIASGTTNIVEGFAIEYSGLAASPYDVSACADGVSVGPAASGATATTAQASELVLGFSASNRVYNAIGAGGYTQRVTGSFNLETIAGDQNLSSTGAGPSFAPTIPSSGTWASSAAAFKATSTAGFVANQSVITIGP